MASSTCFILFIQGISAAPQQPLIRPLNVQHPLGLEPINPRHFGFGEDVFGPSFKSSFPQSNPFQSAKSFGLDFNLNSGSKFGFQKSLYTSPPRLGSGTIIHQTRQLAEYVKETLRQFSKDPIASPYLDRILDPSECITTIGDAVTAIDTSVRLLEDAEAEILRLVDTAESMQSYTDIETLVRVSADIVRQLGKLAPKIAPKNPQICSSSPALTFSVIEKVAQVLEDISNDKRIDLPFSGRSELKTSATVVRGVFKFIKQLGVTFNGFNPGSCVADRNTNIGALSSIGKMVLSLADMFETFGGVQYAEGVRQRAGRFSEVLEAIQKSDLVDVGTLDCNRPGDTTLAAQTMDDIADLIAETGIENLAKQLGVENLI